MDKEQRISFKVILIGIIINIILVAMVILKNIIYWVGWKIAEPQTIWQKAIDDISIWLHTISHANIFISGFITCGIIFFILNIKMEK